MTIERYIGRFAPSPSGLLHFGSLLSATVSYLDAKNKNGLWKLRIDDIDEERSKPQNTIEIINQLKAYGLFPDEIYHQSEHIKDYESYLNKIPKSLLYLCKCNRKRIQSLPQSKLGNIYDGICRDLDHNSGSTRVRSMNMSKKFYDLNFGETQINDEEIYDFIIKRKDSFAYQFCCVIDDFLQGVTNVTRGSDLLYSTLQQRFIQKLLNLPELDYFHHPVLVIDSKKISKSEDATPVKKENRLKNMIKILTLLNQTLPSQKFSYDELIKHAIQNWKSKNIPKVMNISIS